MNLTIILTKQKQVIFSALKIYNIIQCKQWNRYNWDAARSNSRGTWIIYERKDEYLLTSSKLLLFSTKENWIYQNKITCVTVVRSNIVFTLSHGFQKYDSIWMKVLGIVLCIHVVVVGIDNTLYFSIYSIFLLL